MKLGIFSIYDSVTKSYQTPITFPNKESAMRAFSNEANNPDSSICRNHADYSLCHVAEFDLETGIVSPLEPMESLGLATKFIQTEG